ncbi:hypothetical protein GQR58_027994 [Nymphon striatum]|nr:hypothetical protein GQR58_027994 [Nymphon striatum]
MRLTGFLLFSILISLGLVACEGTETASDPSSSTELDFTSSELSETILFSEEMLQTNIQEGFVLKFDETTIQESGSISSNDNTAISGEYDWIISNEKLQVTYPSSVVCTTTKTEEETDEYETTVSCSGGTPNNNKIEGLLLKPISFSKTSLTNTTITIELGDLGDNKQEILDFNSDGSSFTLTEKDNEVESAPVNGTFKSAIYTNTVRLNYTEDEEYSLLVLMDGSTSNGTLLGLRYNSSDDTLTQIRVYSINTNGVWNLVKLFDSVNDDN